MPSGAGAPYGSEGFGAHPVTSTLWGCFGGTHGCWGPPELHPPLQRSLEDELSRTTAQDLPVFAVSYLLVFLYVALALGEYTAWRRVWVRGDGGGGAPLGAETPLGWVGTGVHPWVLGTS